MEIIEQKQSKIRLIQLVLIMLMGTFVFSQVTITPVNTTSVCGGTFTVTINVTGFTDLTTLDFGVCWDPAKLNYAGHSLINNPGGDTPTENITGIGTGEFAYQWSALSPTNSLNGVDLLDGTSILVLNFAILTEGPVTVSACTNGIVTLDALNSLVDNVLINAEILDATAQFSELHLAPQVSSSTSSCGATITTQVKVNSCFEDLTSLQFGVCWDKTKLQYVSSTFPMPYPGGDMPSSNTTNVSNGEYGYLWLAGSMNSSTGVDVADGTILAEMQFTVIGSGSSNIYICDHTALPMEAINVNAVDLEVIADPSASLSNTSYSTITDGDYYAPTTWAGGCIPPNPVPSGYNVQINHNLTLPTMQSITNNGTITSTSPFTNLGTYKGTGVFLGQFINNGAVKPGSN